MEQSDVEKLIGELENALDRLRSLYDQYFVGIERIEPGVARKDVERRIYTLRKEQIRNTALRFRFQMVLQRFNTYQTHWQRVCREIENGTYKRHLLRAERRFGSSRPPRRRSTLPPPVLPEPGAAVPKDLAAELAELDADFAPASIDVDVQVDSRPSSRPPPRPTPRPPPAQGVPPAAPPARAVPLAQPVLKKIAPAGAPPVPASATAAAASTGGAPSPRAAPPVAPRPRPVAPRPGPPPPRPAGSPGAAPPPPPAARPAPPAPPAQRAAPPPAPAPRSVPQPPPPAHRPDPPADAEKPRPAPPRPSLSVAPPRPASAPSELLSEKRLRQIYVEYVDAKRRQNESTAAITYQSVAKSLRDSGDKLRQKHGRAVDFEVAVKDGKTILRPVLK